MRRTLLVCALASTIYTPAAIAQGRPVVVELFTSEGCSSCPPADAFLAELAHTGHDVLPLAFHVTYWNALGWRDPYSLAASTERQARYGERIGGGSYTPEMIVDGRRALIGSDRGKARVVIAAAQASKGEAPRMVLTRTGGTLSIRIDAGRGRARVTVIGYDRLRTTKVGRGENSGRVLSEANIVRSIEPLGLWTGAPLALTAPAPAGEETAVLLEGSDGIVNAVRAGETPPRR